LKISLIKTIVSFTLTLLLIGCSLNSLKYGSDLKDNQALLNPISETIYSQTSSDKLELKILSINGKSTSLFSMSSTHVVDIGEVEFLIRCYYKNRKSFTKFKLNLKNKKVYHIRAIPSLRETVFNIWVDSKIIATKTVKTKLMSVPYHY